MGSIFNPSDPKWIKETRSNGAQGIIVPNVIESTPRGERGMTSFALVKGTHHLYWHANR
jgi:hypothetical protein